MISKSNLERQTQGNAPEDPFWSWSNPSLRGIVWQVLLLSILMLLFVVLARNTVANLEQRGIVFGYDFLKAPAGFDISESPIGFTADQSYIKAFITGIANTFRVSLLGIIFATILGVLVGVGRLSKNGLLRFICTLYVEGLRNIPLLLQLFVWYFAVLPILPDPLNPINPFEGGYLSRMGLALPSPIWSTGWSLGLVGLFLGIITVPLIAGYQRKRQEAYGKSFKAWPFQLFVFFAFPIVLWAIGGAPWEWDFPQQGNFGVFGGMTLSPEFMAILFGLSLYTSAFIAEVVRGGILAVPRGQTEAAESLGLKPSLMMRLVLLPQALRVIIPPTTNQYLNLSKNSSLAVAIGYPEVVSIANTTLNQSGRALEAISILMAVYLTISLFISLLMNWYNARMAIKER